MPKTLLHCTRKWGGRADAHPSSVNETVKITPNYIVEQQGHESRGGVVGNGEEQDSRTG